MTQARWAVLACGLMFGFAGRGTLGCASPDDATEGDDAGQDSGPPIANDGGDEETDPDDAGSDASAACSADGWCRTVLPKEELIEAGILDREAPSLDVRDVWVSPDKSAWAVTITGHVFRWENAAWRVVFDAGVPLHSVWGASPSDLWIGGERGLVLHATDKGGGMTFERVPFAASALVVRVWGTSPSDVWAMTSESVHRFQPGGPGGGPQFSEVPLPDPASGRRRVLTDIWGANGEIWIGGMENTQCWPQPCGNYQTTLVVMKWPPPAGATNWDRIAVHDRRIDPTKPAEFIAGRTATDGTQIAHVVQLNPFGHAFIGVLRVASADAGTLDASAAVDAGDYSWTLEESLTYGRPEALWSTTSDDVWLVGSPGLVRHWDGTAWKIVRVSIHHKLLTNELHAISGVKTASGKLDMWVVGRDIAMHRAEEP